MGARARPDVDSRARDSCAAAKPSWFLRSEAHHHLALVTALFCALALTSLPSSADPSVTGDDATDEYIGTDSILLSRQFDGEASSRRAAADCDGCRWRVTVLCPSDIALLEADPAAAIVNPHPCTADTRSVCPKGTRRLNIYFTAHEDTPLRRIGTGCFGGAGPVKTTTVHSWVRDAQHAKLPPASVRMSPTRVLARMSAQAEIGPTGRHRWHMSVNGHRLVIDARARWHVDWGDGSSTDSQSNRVSHRWQARGQRTVVATVAWTARYWVDGDGPWPVPERLTQTSRTRINVLFASPRLVPW